jgi:hypothetical protein
VENIKSLVSLAISESGPAAAAKIVTLWTASKNKQALSREIYAAAAGSTKADTASRVQTFRINLRRAHAAGLYGDKRDKATILVPNLEEGSLGLKPNTPRLRGTTGNAAGGVKASSAETTARPTSVDVTGLALEGMLELVEKWAESGLSLESRLTSLLDAITEKRNALRTSAHESRKPTSKPAAKAARKIA